MTREAGAEGRASPERALLQRVAAEFERRGYRTYLDPDGTDYFDLAVRRDDEVGLIEGKAGSPANVLEQALVRRAWADWVAVALGSPRGAARLIARTDGQRASFVGVWAAEGGELRELRAARPVPATDPVGAFQPTRDRLREALRALDRGELPASVAWSGVPGEVRRSSGGRRYREWRLDEPVQRD